MTTTEQLADHERRLQELEARVKRLEEMYGCNQHPHVPLYIHPLDKDDTFKPPFNPTC